VRDPLKRGCSFLDEFADDRWGESRRCCRTCSSRVRSCAINQKRSSCLIASSSSSGKFLLHYSGEADRFFGRSSPEELIIDCAIRSLPKSLPHLCLVVHSPESFVSIAEFRLLSKLRLSIPVLMALSDPRQLSRSAGTQYFASSWGSQQLGRKFEVPATLKGEGETPRLSGGAQ
jgi:hypothetical protein